MSIKCPNCSSSDTFTNANQDETHVWLGCYKCGYSVKIKPYERKV